MSGTGGPALFANLGAEEGAAAGAGDAATLAVVEALWRDLFAQPPALDFLVGVEAAAWCNTDDAQAFAAERGCVLYGASPAATRRVHDKAFALEVARAERLLPAPFDRAHVFEPEELADEASALRAIAERTREAPPGARSFTLKPRFGTAGRGRVALTAGTLDEAALRGALPRLAARGGAILEPWVERVADYSTQLRIEGDGQVVLLATLEQLTTGSGQVRGHRGLVDSRGRLSAGSQHDEALKEGALAVALAAAAAGYRGPCGVDAFVYRDGEGEERLRSLVEFNARFTVGLLVMGQVRRAIPEIRATLGLRPGDLRAFAFALSPRVDAGAEKPAGLCTLPSRPDVPDGPVLVAAATPALLDRWVDAAF